ncbi:diacylglycerol kinase family lipid kinase [Bacillus tianshenii]|uniref:diacylglycerol/lipid kinase family protein n=1 Tax=Sutcliffiella tianshenii TaxID=1463404 RepID=UPI001CD1A21A|nr:diacylglycerol kinase family protein [Bacillus tianshenii]MCA1319723.1 diacylglycerol kinase family lipid kinase [Bacillus tianshenii]
MYYFIVNKTSGNGKGANVWSKVQKLLEAKGVEYQVLFTDGTENDRKLVESSIHLECTALVVIGGDGTIHGVANALAYKNVPLGIIPAGSGNDFARSLQISKDHEEALNRILTGKVKTMDLGRVGQEFFITIAGIGFDGKVAKVTNESKMKKLLNKMSLGSLSYIYSLIKVLFTYQPTTATIKIDERIHRFSEVWMISVANLPFYGGGIKICPDARADDGLLDICILHGVNRWELLMVFPRAFSGSHITHKNVTMLKGKDIFITPEKDLVIQCDGEIVAHHPIALTVEKGALHIL